MEKTAPAAQTEPSVTELVSIFGFSLHITWYLCMVLWVAPEFVPSTRDQSSYLTLVPSVVLLLSATLTTFAFANRSVFAKASSLLTRRAGCCVCALLGCVPSVVSGLLPHNDITLAAFCVALFFAGIATVCFFAIWENISMDSGATNHVTYVGVSFCVACALFVLFRICFYGNGALLTLLCIIGSAAVALLIRSLVESTETIDFPDVAEDDACADGAESRRTARDLIDTNVLFLLISMGFGFSLALLTIARSFFLASGLGFGFALAVVLLAALNRNQNAITVRMLEIMCACMVVTAAIVALAARDSLVAMVCCVVVAAFWFVFRALNGGLLIHHAMENDAPSVRYLAVSKVSINAGIPLGWGIACALVAADRLEECCPFVTAALAIAIVLFGFLRLAFTPIPAQTAPSMRERTSFSEQSPTLAHACMAVAKLYQLSPRESEILLYLARGRNARYIAEDLMVSEHTAKSHICRIYKKMDVHSKQELIDLIETTPLG